MSTCKFGFSLIELIIALMVASMMSIVLFNMLFQFNRTTQISDRVITVNEKAERLIQILDHDLEGATTLVDNEPPKPEIDMKQTSTTAGQPQQQQQKKTEPEEKKSPKKVITKLFNSTNAGEQLDTLTFISNNPMASYWAAMHGTESAGKPKPNLVRITYKLKADPEEKNTYILTRQESLPLDWEKRLGKIYDVMTGIKSIAVEYTAKIEKTVTIQEEDDDKQKGKQQAAQPSGQQAQPPPQAKQTKKPKTRTDIEYKVVKTWDVDQKEEEKKDKEDTKGKQEIKQKPIPVLVKVTAKLFDAQRETDVEFVFYVPIITDTEFVSKRERMLKTAYNSMSGSGVQVAQHQPPPFNARLYS